MALIGVISVRLVEANQKTLINQLLIFGVSSFSDTESQVIPMELCGTDWKILLTFAVSFF